MRIPLILLTLGLLSFNACAVEAAVDRTFCQEVRSALHYDRGSRQRSDCGLRQ